MQPLKSANSPLSVALVGARGYSGLALAKILLSHPKARLTHCFATQTDWNLADYLAPMSAKSPVKSVKISAMADIESLCSGSSGFHTAFLATPAEVSMQLAPKLLDRGVNVIDLSGAFRFRSGELPVFEKFYAHAHSAPEWLDRAEFGLLPWVGPLKSTQASKTGPLLIANPGCYATSVLMALIPILRSGLIRPETLVIDAKSGATGAGRKASENLMFTEVDGECLPYKIGKHQHLPEIRAYLKAFSGVEVDPIFTTHLLPVRQGITAGIYARLMPGISGKAAEVEISAAFKEAYAGYPLVEAGPATPAMLSLKNVVGTPMTRISYAVEGDKLHLFSVLDNLMKGAASQAVENFNRLLDLPLETGLF